MREYSTDRVHQKERKDPTEVVHIDGQTIIIANDPPCLSHCQATNAQRLQAVSPLHTALPASQWGGWSDPEDTDNHASNGGIESSMIVEVDMEESRGIENEDGGFTGRRRNQIGLAQLREGSPPERSVRDYENTVPRLKPTANYENCNPQVQTDSHVYVNETFVGTDSNTSEETGYVNVSSHSHSLSQPLLSGNEHDSSGIIHLQQATVLVPARQGTNVITSSVAVDSSGTNTSTHMHRPLPPRTCQTSSALSSSQHTNKLCETSPSDESGYVNIISSIQPSFSATTAQATSMECVSREEVTDPDEHDYENVPQQKSLSQPAPTSSEIIDSLLIPPRTIPRKEFIQTSSETSGALPLPPRSTEHHKATPFVIDVTQEGRPNQSPLPPRSTEHQKSAPSPLIDITQDVPPSKSPAHVSTLTHDSTLGTLSSKELSESVESLDIWPPVIPRHSDLKFIVPSHDSTDYYSDSIDMETNESYVNVK